MILKESFTRLSAAVEWAQAGAGGHKKVVFISPELDHYNLDAFNAPIVTVREIVPPNWYLFSSGKDSIPLSERLANGPCSHVSDVLPDGSKSCCLLCGNDGEVL